MKLSEQKVKIIRHPIILGGKINFFSTVKEELTPEMKKAMEHRLKLNLHNIRQLKHRFINDPIALKLIEELEEVHQEGIE